MKLKVGLLLDTLERLLLRRCKAVDCDSGLSRMVVDARASNGVVYWHDSEAIPSRDVGCARIVIDSNATLFTASCPKVRSLSAVESGTIIYPTYPYDGIGSKHLSGGMPILLFLPGALAGEGMWQRWVALHGKRMRNGSSPLFPFA